jgi:NTP pyrophosphatase (non-canonical NTP hydrolase)
MAEQFNGLTPAEAERLFYLLEELGEAQQAIGKILRHGYESRDPTKAVPVTDDNRGGTVGWRNTSPTNRQMLASELGDVMRGIEMLRKAGDVSRDIIADVAAKGPPSKYMHHQSNS